MFLHLCLEHCSSGKIDYEKVALVCHLHGGEAALEQLRNTRAEHGHGRTTREKQAKKPYSRCGKSRAGKRQETETRAATLGQSSDMAS